MARHCNVCVHARLEEIDRQLVAGVPRAVTARAFGLSPDSVEHHARRHLPATLVQGQQAKEIARAEDLVAQARDLHTRTLNGLAEAERSGDLRTMMVVVRETRRNLEFLSRLLGQIDERPQINVFATPEWFAVQEVVYAVLEPHPELRYTISERLAALDSGAPPP